MVAVDIEKRMRDYTNFKQELERLKEQYAGSHDPEALVSGIRRLSGNPVNHPYTDYLLLLGESYLDGGDSVAGMACMKATAEFFPEVNNTTLFYLRMAEHHIENGDTETGKACLVRLCECVDNYEESIEWNELTPVWEKYKHLVEGLVEPSVCVMGSQPKTPGQCDMQIGEILALGDDEVLNSLSEHLNELTANGEYLNSLNKWERAAWYVDELCMELNSGGFEGYLYYHGTHFEKACKALDQMGAAQMTALLDQVQSKFPRGRIPKSESAIQNAMDVLEEKGVDFEREDDIYYGGAERELLARLTAFVRENAKRFR